MPAASANSENESYGNLQRIESFQLPCQDQSQSPLFSVLPAELRDTIYGYVFADYEDLTQPYDLDNCYRRPGCLAPRTSDTALLRTCQAIYSDCWYLPWTLSQHTFFLACDSRRPDKILSPEELAQICAFIARPHSRTEAREPYITRRKEIAHAQIFAQLCNLEEGRSLSEILDVPHFRPRNVTITVRHTDIWDWESDSPIAMYECTWVWTCTFPESVRNVCFQLESLERRKEQVDWMMNKIRKGWYFTRSDGEKLLPVQSGHGSEVWFGGSTWEGVRWLPDEDDREPGVLRFYLASLDFRIERDEKVRQQRLMDLERHSIKSGLSVPHDIAAKSTRRLATSLVSVEDLEMAGITDRTPASEAMEMLHQWYFDREQNRAISSGA